MIGLAAFWALLALWAWRDVRRCVEAHRAARGHSVVQFLCFAATVFVILAHVVTPGFAGVLLMIALGAIGLASRVAAGIAGLFRATARAVSGASARAGG